MPNSSPPNRPPPALPFADRSEAGRLLAQMLLDYRDDRPVVLALPRGGVPVGYEIARALDAPLDVFLVRKIGVPGQRELAMGAVASGGVTILDQALIRMLGVRRDEIARVVAEEEEELARRERLFRDDRPPPHLRDATVILVDDGLATGSSARAALRALRAYQPRRLVLAEPVCAAESVATLADEADAIVCLAMPEPFYAVGLWYHRFDQTTDAEVIELLRRAREEHAAHSGAGAHQGAR